MLAKAGRAFIVMVWLFTPSAHAQNHSFDKLERAANNLGHELVICSAYFYIAAIGMLNMNDEKGREMASHQKQKGDALLRVAGDIGQIIHQKPEAIDARLKMAIADMRKEMDNHFVNFSILLEKYARPCVDLHAGVNGRLTALVENSRQ